ncbi:hypothetical protein [Desulfopila inferna]|uniref:hypothetical protein n=1 Tax=Desulfopila inferna TaxID=468528 RepID=UPI001964351F|nr:hypothetical protein [Desulfopila inferna]MBM9606588.1 hypothetical protein [Desulfopila inferna]
MKSAKISSGLLLISVVYSIFLAFSVSAAPLIIDHRHTDITVLTREAIEQAKERLHIAYGHTSHGSQLTTGMAGLVEFANGGGLGLSLPANIFAWNNGGTDGALDLHDSFMIGDAGGYPQWVDRTREYLDNPENSDVNVVIWSWCGQVSDKYRAGTLESEYLLPMTRLEQDYPQVKFVYMTGHAHIDEDADTKAGNEIIRNYCRANEKILYDFNDIESYDPDGTYYEFPDDSCDYHANPWFSRIGNWAIEWQDSHVEGDDWYNCESAHSQPLNANRKAYAAWYLWAALEGWTPAGVDIHASGGQTTVTEGGEGADYQFVLRSQPSGEVIIDLDPDIQTDISNGAGGALSLNFTPATWNIPQRVQVTAVDDSWVEGQHMGTISIRVTSSDRAYDGVEVDDITVVILDNDQQGGSHPTEGIRLLLLQRDQGE